MQIFEYFFFYRLLISALTWEIQLSRGWDPINQINPATCWCLSQASTWISNAICHGLFSCSMSWGERWLFVLLIEVIFWTTIYFCCLHLLNYVMYNIKTVCLRLADVWSSVIWWIDVRCSVRKRWRQTPINLIIFTVNNGH
jgi:hypothetical protein